MGEGNFIADYEVDVRVLTGVLYGMGLLQRILKFEPPFGPGTKLKRVPGSLTQKL